MDSAFGWNAPAFAATRQRALFGNASTACAARIPKSRITHSVGIRSVDFADRTCRPGWTADADLSSRAFRRFAGRAAAIGRAASRNSHENWYSAVVARIRAAECTSNTALLVAYAKIELPKRHDQICHSAQSRLRKPRMPQDPCG